MATSAIDQLPSTSTAPSTSAFSVEGGATTETPAHGWGHPRQTAEEPGNYEVLIDSVEAALSKNAKLKDVLRSLCSVAVPNGLLLKRTYPVLGCCCRPTGSKHPAMLPQ